MKRRSIVIGGIIGVVALIIGTTLIIRAHMNQAVNVPPNQWVRIPDNATYPSNAFAFKSSSGHLIAFVPATPSTSTTWSQWQQPTTGCAIPYPSTWTQQTIDHDGMQFMPLGTDPNVPGGPEGFTVQFFDQFTVDTTDPSVVSISTVKSGSLTGHLYSVSGLGALLIATYPVQGKTLVIVSTTQTNDMIAVFQHVMTTVRC